MSDLHSIMKVLNDLTKETKLPTASTFRQGCKIGAFHSTKTSGTFETEANGMEIPWKVSGKSKIGFYSTKTPRNSRRNIIWNGNS